MLRVEEIVKTYGRRRVVDGVSMHLGPGEVVGLLGPNGAGKTTTFHSITGFVRPDGGRVLLDDEDLTCLPMYQRARRGIGYLPQETSIFRGLSVAQNVSAVLEARGVGRRQREERVAGLLAELDLEARAGQRADSLSGGETFLASLALALGLAEMVGRRGGRLDAFFLDEGFGTLDPEHLDLAMEGVESLVADRAQRLVVVVSHVSELRQRIEDLIVLDKDPLTGDSIVAHGGVR